MGIHCLQVFAVHLLFVVLSDNLLNPLYLEILPPCTFIKPSTFIRNTRVVVGAISIAFASPPSKTIESGFEELNASVSEVFVNRTHSLQLDNF